MVECTHKVPDLVLMRHCKSAYPAGVVDHDRPLNTRGERDSRAAAQWFARENLSIEQVWVSSATRAQQTWAGIASAFNSVDTSPEVRTHPDLYEASTDSIISMLRECRASRLLVIAHNPGLVRVISTLTTVDSHGWLRSIEQKYPTGAICVLRLPGWPALDTEAVELIDYAVPRASSPMAR